MSKRPDIDQMDVWRQLAAATEEKPVKIYRDAKLIDIERIKSDPDQPRKTFDEDTLVELATSIEDKGLMQPLVVRPQGDEFIIVAGHRRRMACERIGMQYIPCIVRDISKREAREQALVENIQRDDIPPIEEAESYRLLMDEYGYSVRNMADRVGKSAAYIHSRLGLLKYPDIARRVQAEQIGIYEARELARIKDEDTRTQLADKVVAEDLDREAFQQAVNVAKGQAKPEKPEPEAASDVELEEQEPLAEPHPSSRGDLSATPAKEPAEVAQQAEVRTDVASEEPVSVAEPEAKAHVLFGQEDLRRQWRALERTLIHLDLDDLSEEERSEARQILEEIRDRIDSLLE